MRKYYSNGSGKGGGADRMKSMAEKEFDAYNKIRNARDKEEFLKRRREEMEQDRRRLEEKRKGVAVADGGRIGYRQGSMPSFQPSGLPGFLTSFGLNLLSTPPQGNIFQTAATAAQDPFRTLQAQQAAAMKTASDRAFAKELAQEEREFDEKQLEKKLAAQERIANMGKTDNVKRIEKFTQDFGDEIKAARAVDFIDNKFQDLELEYGKGQVATIPIDSDAFTGKGKKGALKKFADNNPRLLGLKLYDVAQDRVVVIRLNKTNNQLELVPADSADIDTTGDAQPAPGVKRSFDYLNPDQIKKLDELSQEDMFSDIYSGS